MRVRLFVGSILLVTALILVTVSVVRTGLPWGFRGHQAVILEATGMVDVALSEERIAREQRETAGVPPTPGLFLDVGDEVRVGRYSELRLRLPSGDVTVRDGGQVVLGTGAAGEPAVRLVRGLVHATSAGGQGALEILAVDLGATLDLRAPGGDVAAVVSVLVDGSGMSAAVLKGRASVRSPMGTADVQAGQVVAASQARGLRVEPRPTSLALTGSCADGQLTIAAPDGTQIFVAGGLHGPKDGTLRLNAPERATTVVAFARDVAGNVASQTLSCSSGADAGPKQSRSDRPGKPR